eukprot:UN26851
MGVKGARRNLQIKADVKRFGNKNRSLTIFLKAVVYVESNRLNIVGHCIRRREKKEDDFMAGVNAAKTTETPVERPKATGTVVQSTGEPDPAKKKGFPPGVTPDAAARQKAPDAAAAALPQAAAEAAKKPEKPKKKPKKRRDQVYVSTKDPDLYSLKFDPPNSFCMDGHMMPRTYVIGTMKCGTSTFSSQLHHTLNFTFGTHKEHIYFNRGSSEQKDIRTFI